MWTCLQLFTIDVPEIQFIGNHNSQSDGQNKSAKSGMNLRKKTIHTNSLQRKREDTKDNRYLTLNKAGKNGPMKFRPDCRAAVMMKNRLNHESGREPIEEPIHPGEDYLSSARVDQQYRMAILAFISRFLVVVRIRMELEVSSQKLFFFLLESPFLLQLVSFRGDSDPLQPTGCVNRTPLTLRIFSHICTHFILVHMHLHGSRCRSACLLKTCSSTCHRVSDLCVVSPSIDLFLSFECLYLLSILFISSILVIILHVVETAEYWSPLRTRRMRIIAPWRYTTLSQRIDDCFEIHFPHWRLCDLLLSTQKKKFCARYGFFSMSPSARSPCHPGSLADFGISVF